MKKGFTLVELAIVLVVIGLLVGMSFKGKTLVDAARIKNDVRKINKLETALNTYFASYNTFPGKKADGTYTDVSIMDDFIAEGLLKHSDFKLTTFVANIHFVGCEERIIEGGPVLYPIAINAKEPLCLAFSNDPHTDAVINSPNMAMKELYICYLETLLDDSNILTGNGRKTTFKHTGFSITYKDCSPLANNVSTGPGNQFAYLYRIY